MDNRPSLYMYPSETCTSWPTTVVGRSFTANEDGKGRGERCIGVSGDLVVLRRVVAEPGLSVGATFCDLGDVPTSLQLLTLSGFCTCFMALLIMMAGSRGG